MGSEQTRPQDNILIFPLNSILFTSILENCSIWFNLKFILPFHRLLFRYNMKILEFHQHRAIESEFVVDFHHWCRSNKDEKYNILQNGTSTAPQQITKKVNQTISSTHQFQRTISYYRTLEETVLTSRRRTADNVYHCKIGDEKKSSQDQSTFILPS